MSRITDGYGERGLVWMSVRRRMPEDGQRVLAYSYNHRVHDLTWSEADNVWYGDIAAYIPQFVTHWMQMPEAPEVE